MNEKFKALKPPFKYDEYCQAILNIENQRVLDLRGWGFIQKLPTPEKIQDDFGNELVRLMNTRHDSEEVERLREANKMLVERIHDMWKNGT